MIRPSNREQANEAKRTQRNTVSINDVIYILYHIMSRDSVCSTTALLLLLYSSSCVCVTVEHFTVVFHVELIM